MLKRDKKRGEENNVIKLCSAQVLLLFLFSFAIAFLISLSFIPKNAKAQEVIFIVSDVFPKKISQGEERVFNITLVNRGFKEAYRVTAEVLANVSSPLKVIGNNKVYIDFREKPCVDPRICGYFEAGDRANISFTFKASENAENGIYYIPLSVKWEDISGEQKEQVLYFGVEIKGKPEIELTFNEISEIIYPNTEFPITLNLKNVGNENAEKVRVKLSLPEDIEGRDIAYFSEIGVGEEKQAEFNLKTVKHSEAGEKEIKYFIKFYDKNENEYEKNGSIKIFVHEKNRPRLAISEISSEPSKIYRDSDFKLKVALENVGEQKAKNVKIELSLPEGIEGEDTAFLGTVEGGISKEAEFDLKTSKDIDTGEHGINIKVSYLDESDAPRSEEKSAGIFVFDRGEIDLEIAGVTTSVKNLKQGDEFTLSVQIENIGKQDAKSVYLRISPNLNEISGKLTSFLGKIESDDSATGIFDLKISEKAETGLKTIPVEIHYKNEVGKELVEIKNIEIFVNKKESNKRIIYAGAFVALLIIVYLGFKLRGRGEEE